MTVRTDEPATEPGARRDGLWTAAVVALAAMLLLAWLVWGRSDRTPTWPTRATDAYSLLERPADSSRDTVDTTGVQGCDGFRFLGELDGMTLHLGYQASRNPELADRLCLVMQAPGLPTHHAYAHVNPQWDVQPFGRPRVLVVADGFPPLDDTWQAVNPNLYWRFDD